MTNLGKWIICCIFIWNLVGVTHAQTNLTTNQAEDTSTHKNISDEQVLVIPVGVIYVQWGSNKYSGLAGILSGAIGGLISGFIENSDGNEISANRKFLKLVVDGENFQSTFATNLATKLNMCKINALALKGFDQAKVDPWAKEDSPSASAELMLNKTNGYFIETGLNLFKITGGLTADSLQGYATAKVFDVKTRMILKKYIDSNGFTQPVNLKNFSTDNPRALGELQKALREVVEIVNQNIADSICSDYGSKY